MTEKRFYYNTFYYPNTDEIMEYEIIDRESFPNYPNHNASKEIPNWYIYISANDSNWQDMCIDKLNELHEENQQCENEIARLQLINDKLKDKDYTNYNKKIQELHEENKELKSLCKVLIKHIEKKSIAFVIDKDIRRLLE